MSCQTSKQVMQKQLPDGFNFLMKLVSFSRPYVLMLPGRQPVHLDAGHVMYNHFSFIKRFWLLKLTTNPPFRLKGSLIEPPCQEQKEFKSQGIRDSNSDISILGRSLNQHHCVTTSTPNRRLWFWAQLAEWSQPLPEFHSSNPAIINF